jgi:hypothetical protein
MRRILAGLALLLCAAGAKANLLPYDLPSQNDRFLQTQLYSMRQTLTGAYAYNAYTYAPSILLADGSMKNLRPYFRPVNNWQDTEVMFYTRLIDSNRARLDVLWGGSTGQEAQKMYVQPSARVGLFFAAAPTDTFLINAKFTTVVAGGRTIERPCMADYGQIVGVQAVKCSLASSVLPPAQTLAYLQNTPSKEQIVANIELKWFF